MAILLYVSKKGDWSGWIGDTPETVMITRTPMVLKMWQYVNIQVQNDRTGN